MTADIPTTHKVIQISKTGGPEVLELNQIPVQKPGKGQIQIKAEYAGINFLDTYFRRGIYPIKEFPFSLGQEASGTVVALGEDIDPEEYGFKVGDRVVCLFSGLSGAYSEYPIAPAEKTFKIPENVTTKEACTVLLQGLTAQMLFREYHYAKSGQYILVHSAAGGLGLLLCQCLKHLGVHVIGTTSTEKKAELIKEYGAKHVVLYADRSPEDVAKDVKELTPDGLGVHAVFDGIGRDTFVSDFDVLRPRGSLVLYGAASGHAPGINPLSLAHKGLKLSRPSLTAYFINRQEFQDACADLFDLVSKSVIKAHKHKEDGYEFTLENVRQAQEDLIARKTTGKVLLKIC